MESTGVESPSALVARLGSWRGASHGDDFGACRRSAVVACVAEGSQGAGHETSVRAITLGLPCRTGAVVARDRGVVRQASVGGAGASMQGPALADHSWPGGVPRARVNAARDSGASHPDHCSLMLARFTERPHGPARASPATRFRRKVGCAWVADAATFCRDLHHRCPDLSVVLEPAEEVPNWIRLGPPASD